MPVRPEASESPGKDVMKNPQMPCAMTAGLSLDDAAKDYVPPWCGRTVS